MNRPERFNAKARRSSSTTFSHKRGKQSRPKTLPIADTNPEVLPRKSTEEKEIDRREQLKKEVTVLRPTCKLGLTPSVAAVTLTFSVKSF